MKVLILLAIIGIISVQVSDARNSAFMCSGECYPYDFLAFCISNGSVVCDNCSRDKMLCENSSLSSSECDSSACDQYSWK